jgi:hypothetical protein
VSFELGSNSPRRFAVLGVTDQENAFPAGLGSGGVRSQERLRLSGDVRASWSFRAQEIRDQLEDGRHGVPSQQAEHGPLTDGVALFERFPERIEIEAARLAHAGGEKVQAVVERAVPHQAADERAEPGSVGQAARQEEHLLPPGFTVPAGDLLEQVLVPREVPGG